MKITKCSLKENDQIQPEGQINIGFDQQLNYNTITNDTVYIINESNHKVGSITFEKTDSSNFVIKYQKLDFDKNYKLIVKAKTLSEKGVMSLIPNDSIQTDYVINFKTINQVNLVIDPENTSTDLSDLPINLYQQTNSFQIIQIKNKNKTFDGNFNVICIDQQQAENVQNNFFIDIEDIFGIKVPCYVFYKTNENIIEISIKQIDSSAIPNCQIVTFFYEDASGKSYENFFMTDISPKPISEFFIRQKLGQIQQQLTYDNFRQIYLDQLIEYDKTTKQNLFEPYKGHGKEIDPTTISNNSYKTVNYEYRKEITVSNVLKTYDQQYQEYFKTIIMYKQAEYLLSKQAEYKSIALENYNISFNNDHLLQMMKYYKQLQNEQIEKLQKKEATPKVAVRGKTINSDKLVTLQKVFSKQNIFRGS